MVFPNAERRRAHLDQVLSALARTLAESLELRVVFDRVADALRKVLPFDVMGVIRLGDADTLLVYNTTFGLAQDAPGRRIPRSAYSPVLWPSHLVPSRIQDTSRELDASFPRDREVLDAGLRSILRCPLRLREQPIGFLWFASRLPGAFAKEDEAAVLPVADLVTLALEHERLAASERRRRHRLAALQRLVPVLSRALDIREVFGQLSGLVQDVIPHDRMVLSDHPDGPAIRIHAYSGARLPDAPEEVRLEKSDEPDWQEREFVIVRDAAQELDPRSERGRLMSLHGYRSLLRVPVLLEGKPVAHLVFLSLSIGSYEEADVELAGRIADHVALVLSHQRLADEVRRTAQAQQQAALLQEKVAFLTRELASIGGQRRIVGSAPAWQEVLLQASKAAPTEATVLLTGESGTGKEVVARFLHRASRRGAGPFVAVNAAALPDQLLESELFGHEKGAFTGATASKPGRIEQAAGGTLFLDEVGEMSPAVQAKVLRVLQEKEFRRLGGMKLLHADVRVVAATNRDLADAIQRGDFREDLYYRLHVFEIHLPPLRERVSDIPLLADEFLEEIGREVGRPIAGLSAEARALMLAHPWPGNVRELRNALERAAILSEGSLIRAEHLPLSMSRALFPAAAYRLPPSVAPALKVAEPAPETVPAPDRLDLPAHEKALVEEALRKARHNKTKAASLLGITRSQLYTRLSRYGLLEG